jgi:hypothetical protein
MKNPEILMISRVTVFIFLFSTFGLWAQDSIPNYTDTNIQLKTYLDKDKVPQNNEVVYHVDLSWKGELDRYQISNIGDPVVSNLKLRGSGSSNRFFVDDAGNPKSVKQVNFYFTPIEMGMAYIDGITIQYEDKILNQKETLSAQRLGVKIIEPLPDPTAGPDIGFIVIISIVIIFIIVVIYFVIRFIKQRKLNAQAEDDIPKTIEEKYLELLDGIELSSENRNETLSSITKLLNSYFSEKYELSGSAGFDQIKPELVSLNINEDLQEKVNNLFERDKLTKFAREQVAENELHLFFDTVEQLIKQIQKIELEKVNDQ